MGAWLPEGGGTVRWPWRKDSAETMRKAEILRQLHWQCWREDAPPLETPLADLVEVLPVLIESGSVGLVWPRLWHRAEELGAVGAALAAAYDAQVAHNARVERDIARVVTRLREQSVEPVLIKGFAVARLYPAPLVRPAGDIDLVVREDEYQLAERILAEPADDPLPAVDLKCPETWQEGPKTDFWPHTCCVNIGGTSVLVLAPEDELRVQIFHFLRHGATRITRLCDIALLYDRHVERLDWERVLGTDPIRRNWTLTVLGICIELVGLMPQHIEISQTIDQFPVWLLPTVERRLPKRQRGGWIGMPHALTHPKRLPEALSIRWVDPVTATVFLPTAFSGKYALTVQAAAYVKLFYLYGARMVTGRRPDLFHRGMNH